jgi:hypothetical protein
MQNPKRNIAISSVFAMLLYFVPNMVQDVHRILGHPDYPIESHAPTGVQLLNQSERCPVCIFEFNVVDEAAIFVYVPLLQSEISLFAENCENQVQNKIFHYYNLRAPPMA